MKNSKKICFFSQLWAKRTLQSSNFLNYKLSILKNLWNSNLIPTFLFLIFLVLGLRGERKSNQIPIIEKESLGWHRFRPQKQVIWMLISFLDGESLSKVSPPKLVWNDRFRPKKMVSGWLWILDIILGLLGAINMFYKVFKVLYFFFIKMWLK